MALRQKNNDKKIIQPECIFIASELISVRNTNVSIQCWKCPLEDETQVAGNGMQGNT